MTTVSLELESSVRTATLRGDHVDGYRAASAVTFDMDPEERRWELEWSRRNIED